LSIKIPPDIAGAVAILLLSAIWKIRQSRSGLLFVSVHLFSRKFPSSSTIAQSKRANRRAFILSCSEKFCAQFAVVVFPSRAQSRISGPVLLQQSEGSSTGRFHSQSFLLNAKTKKT